jgi:hypothetical protein
MAFLIPSPALSALPYTPPRVVDDEEGEEEDICSWTSLVPIRFGTGIRENLMILRYARSRPSPKRLVHFGPKTRGPVTSRRCHGHLPTFEAYQRVSRR